MGTRFEEQYRLELSKRQPTSSLVDIVNLDGPVEEAPYLVPGTAALFWAKRDSRLFAELIRALQAKSYGRIDALLDADVRFDFGSQTPVNSGLSIAPALAELSYGSKVLIEGATYLPYAGDHLSCALLFYSGGPVTPSRFRAQSYCLPGASPLHFVVVLNPPHQTELERRLVASLTPQQAEAHFLTAQPMTTPAAAATARFVAATVAAHAVDKAVDYAADKAQHWAQNVERNQAKARAAQERRQHAVDETQYRYGLGPIPESIVKTLEELDPTLATQRLLEIRRSALDQR